MALEAAIGMGLGGLMQGAGAFLGGSSAKKAASKNRKALLAMFQEGKQMMSAATQEERDRAMQGFQRAQYQARTQYTRAQQRAEADAFNLFASPAYQAQAAFLQQQFSQGIPDVMANEVAGRLRTAQAARGLGYGGAPAKDEANLLGKMAHESRMQLLPQLRQMAFDPMQVRQQAAQSYLAQQGGAQGLGLAPFQAQMQGLSTAQNIAGSRVNPLLGLGGQMFGQMPFSAASPMANALGAIGGTIGGLGSMMGGGGSVQSGGNSSSPGGRLVNPLQTIQHPTQGFNLGLPL